MNFKKILLASYFMINAKASEQNTKKMKIDLIDRLIKQSIIPEKIRDLYEDIKKRYRYHQAIWTVLQSTLCQDYDLKEKKPFQKELLRLLFLNMLPKL